MADDDNDVNVDMAWVEERLAAPDSGLDSLRSEFPFLRSAADARCFLEEIREGLASVQRGELYTTQEVMGALEASRRTRPAA